MPSVHSMPLPTRKSPVEREKYAQGTVKVLTMFHFETPIYRIELTRSGSILLIQKTMRLAPSP
jgi:hypothetical protein